MRVTIRAASAPQTSDEQPRWTVDIYVNEQLVKESAPLQDPLDRKERALCRWYLDKYRQKEPYSTTKAKSAAKLLEGYGLNLVAQLGLWTIIQQFDNIVFEISDIVSTDGDVAPSIHRLYWEFLEDSSLWKDDSIVKVNRVGSTAFREELETSAEPESHAQRVNLLLVTARDLTRDWTSDADISPSLIANILWDIQSLLDKHECNIKLNIEIDRPGTFSALKQHLQWKQGGYFDIIHFDMHGSVNKDDHGTPTGCLHFSDPDSDATELIAAKDVAELKALQKIPLVVFNACDSAHASSGDQANIARVFQAHGSSHVLGMAHRASESATSKFFDVFYTQLLVEGRSLQQAVRVSRLALRSQPLRDARFQLQIPVIDWTIPVLYTTGEDLYFKSADAMPAVEQSTLSTKDVTPSQTKSPLIGRDFDYLRLEKLLISSEGVISVSGSHGVGKTSVLRALSESWTRSGFINRSIFINFSTQTIKTLDHFIEEALLQGRASHTINSQKWDSCNDAARKRFITHFSQGRTVFILDGVMDPTLHDNEQRQQLLSHIISLMERLAQKPEQSARSEGIYTILSGRTDSCRDLRFKDTEIPVYELKGLHRADAVSLVLDTARSMDSTHSNTKGHTLKEVWKAEPLAHLLEGSPGALIHFTRLGQPGSVDLLKQYENIHSEDPAYNIDVNKLRDEYPPIQEFMDIVKTLSDDVFACWLMVSWFWHQGPNEHEFASMVVEGGIFKDKTIVGDALREAARWGYIRLDVDGRISWINPLFTILNRIVGRTSACRYQLPSEKGWSARRQRFAKKTMKHLLPNGPQSYIWPSQNSVGLEYAVQLLKVVLSSHFARETSMRFCTYLIYFFKTMNTICDPVLNNMLKMGAEYDGLNEDCDGLKENFLFSLKLCRGRGICPTPHIAWPKTLVLILSHPIVRACKMEQTAIVAKYYEQLLNGTICFSKTWSGGNGHVKMEDVPMVLELACELAEMHRRHIPGEKSRKWEFIKIGKKVLEDSESHFGPLTDPAAKMTLSLFHFVHALMLLDDRRADESKEELLKATSGWRETQTLDPQAHTRFTEFLERQQPAEAALWESFVNSSEMETSKVEDLWNLALAEAMGFDLREVEGSKRSGIRAAPHPMGSTIDSLLRNFKQVVSPTSRSLNYENEMDRGQWRMAMGYHTTPILQSFSKFDFDQVEEHVAAQERIAETHGVTSETREQLGHSKEVTRMFREFMAAMASGSVTKEQLVYMRDFLLRIAANYEIDPGPTAKLTQIVLDSWEKDQDPNRPHNWAPSVLALGSGNKLKSSMTQFMKKHLSRSVNSKQYGQMVSGGLVVVLETLQALEDAEDAGDEETIFKKLDEMEALSLDKDTKDMVKGSGVKERRVWNVHRLVEACRDEINKQPEDAMDVKTCHKAMDRCCRIIHLGRQDHKVEFKKVLRGFENLKEEFHLSSLCQRASRADDQNDQFEFFKVAEEILNHYRQGAFKIAMKQPEHVNGIKAVLGKYYISSISKATEERRWPEAKNLFAEWRGDELLWSSSNSTIISMAEICDKMGCISEFWMALLDLDFLRARELLEELRQLNQRPSRADDNGGFGEIAAGLLTHDFGETLVAGSISRMFREGPDVARRHIAIMVEEIKKAQMLFP